MKIKLFENFLLKNVLVVIVMRELFKIIVKSVICGNFCKYGEECLI